MIIDEKWMHPPPPPYYRPPPPAFAETAANATSSGDHALAKPTFSTLPAHLLLQIVYSTFPQRDGQYEGEGKIERQRLNLYWLETSLRLVNKALYTACMHILRSTYLPAYESLIRPPYTSDPFSSSILTTSTTSDSAPVHRELATLDLFIALLAHEDLLLDATSLHLPREEAYKDLFDMVQPRSRLEDLILEEGINAGLVYTLKYRVNPLPFEALSVSFSPRRVALVYTPAISAAKKALVEVGRAREEKLEESAKRLVEGLHAAMAAGEV
ncbi:hypothetical protein EV368DRAFT_29170 [Lentinula lateritia]|nr:hypothetical protein EV368DRAFT_29170 [Lentinula lateritia]